MTNNHWTDDEWANPGPRADYGWSEFSANCLLCGEPALRAMPLEDAVRAHPYVCFHCTEDDPEFAAIAAIMEPTEGSITP